MFDAPDAVAVTKSTEMEIHLKSWQYTTPLRPHHSLIYSLLQLQRAAIYVHLLIGSLGLRRPLRSFYALFQVSMGVLKLSDLERESTSCIYTLVWMNTKLHGLRPAQLSRITRYGHLLAHV